MANFRSVILFAVSILVFFAFNNCGKTFLVQQPTLRSASGSALVFIEWPKNSNFKAGSKVSISFKLKNRVLDRYITDADLSVHHEKKLHFIFYDEALKVFKHVHPIYLGEDLWEVFADLSTNGDYHVWAQGELLLNETVFQAYNKFSVSGGAPANPKPLRWDEERNGVADSSIVKLSAEKIYAGQFNKLTFSFSRQGDAPPQLTQYLSAWAHVIMVPLSGDKIIHVHTMDLTPDFKLTAHITPDDLGDHRLWIEFIDGGVLKAVPLALKIEEKVNTPPAAVSTAPAPPPPPANTNISFKTHVLPILKSKCLACHGSDVYNPTLPAPCRGWLAVVDVPLGSKRVDNGGATGCPDLSLYDRLLTIAPWECEATSRYVLPGDKANSYLYQKMIGTKLCPKEGIGYGNTKSEIMPPPGSPQLTPQELDIFAKWIDQGAKNN